MFKYEIYAQTETGSVRSKNEDHILVGRFIKNQGGLELALLSNDDYLESYGLLLAVADGIGGERGGCIASHRVLSVLERHFYTSMKEDCYGDFKDILIAASERANETLLALANQRSELAGMGCTLTGICLTPCGYLVFNSGDSRVYRIRNGTLKRLTEDDTLARLAVREGHSTLKEASASPYRHTLVNHLGSPSFNLMLEVGPELRDQDCILICSDGLYDYAPEKSMEKILCQPDITVPQLGQQLVEKAISGGGGDNVSVILMRAGATDLED